MCIREVEMKDYEEVLAIVREVHQLHAEVRPDVYRGVEVPLGRERFQELLGDDQFKVMGIEVAGKVVGYSVVRILSAGSLAILEPHKFGYIEEFCIRNDYKKRGLGKALFEYIVKYAKNEGASSLQLNVWAFNEGAIAFYECMGMKTRNIRMELDLYNR